jgi:hypothetical protein
MPPEQDSKDEETGFETSAELRHGETFPPPMKTDELFDMAGDNRRRWVRSGWVKLFVALLVIGLVTYFLVTSL